MSMMTPSGICSAALVVLISLVVAGILAVGTPDAFFIMIAITTVLMVAAIIFLRQQENDRTPGEYSRLVRKNPILYQYCGKCNGTGKIEGLSEGYYQTMPAMSSGFDSCTGQPGTVTGDQPVYIGPQKYRRDCPCCNGLGILCRGQPTTRERIRLRESRNRKNNPLLKNRNIL
jgi:hypothetical protein